MKRYIQILLKVAIAATALSAVTISIVFFVYKRGALWYTSGSSGWKHHMKSDWVNVPSNDSIGVFCIKGKRGYFNSNTMEIIVPPIFDKACIFSEGLAAVQKGDSIAYIDHSGKIVIPFMKSLCVIDSKSYQFKNDHCVMAGPDGKKGVLDKSGQWLIKPEYSSISLTDNYAVVCKNGTKKQIAYDSTIINDFVFDCIYELTFEVEKLEGTEEGDKDYVTYKEGTGIYVYSVNEKCGMMDSKFNLLTDPIYSEIEAVNENTFIATLSDGDSRILLDKKGNVINIEKN